VVTKANQLPLDHLTGIAEQETEGLAEPMSIEHTARYAKLALERQREKGGSG
jgi:hypothetical protein